MNKPLSAFSIHDVNSQRIKLEKEKFVLMANMQKSRATDDDQEKLRLLNIQITQFAFVADAFRKDK